MSLIKNFPVTVLGPVFHLFNVMTECGSGRNFLNIHILSDQMHYAKPSCIYHVKTAHDVRRFDQYISCLWILYGNEEIAEISNHKNEHRVMAFFL